MKKTINLRNKPGRSILLGILIMLIGILIFLKAAKPTDKYATALIFCMVGLFLAGYINRMCLFIDKQELVHQRGLFFPLFNHSYNLNKVRCITVKEKIIEDYNEGSYDQYQTIYPVHLSGIKGAIAAKPRSPWRARKIAEELARALNKPMNNMVYKKSSIRAADELDMPVIERWKREHNYPSKLPEAPANTQLDIKRSGNAFIVYLKAEHHSIKFALLMLTVITAIAVVSSSGMSISPFIYYGIFGSLYLFTVLILLSFSGHSKFEINGKSVSFRQGLSPIKSRINLNEIEEYIVARDGIHLVGDRSSVWIHWGDNLKDSEYLEKAIPFELMRFGTTIR